MSHGVDYHTSVAAWQVSIHVYLNTSILHMIPIKQPNSIRSYVQYLQDGQHYRSHQLLSTNKDPLVITKRTIALYTTIPNYMRLRYATYIHHSEV